MGSGSAGTVVLHGLRNPGLDLSDPRRFRRMGGQELGRALAPLRSLGHPMPEVERRVRVVARLGHEDEAEMVGLRLLGAAPGQDQPHRGSCAEECGRLPNERGIVACQRDLGGDRKSTRLNSSHRCISYAVFCLKKKKKQIMKTNKRKTT